MIIIVVQQIKSYWSKEERSAPGATLRNRLPDRLPIQFAPDAPDELSLIHHYAEWRYQFKEQPNSEEVTVHAIRKNRLEQVNSIGSIHVRWQDEQLHVNYRYNYYVGAPERAIRPRRVLTLVPGQWGRVEYNGRHSGYAQWGYTKNTFNCTVTDIITPNLFDGEPHRTFSDMAHLL